MCLPKVLFCALLYIRRLTALEIRRISPAATQTSFSNETSRSTPSNSTAAPAAKPSKGAANPPVALIQALSASCDKSFEALRLPDAHLPDHVVESGIDFNNGGNWSGLVLGFVMIQDKTGLWQQGGVDPTASMVGQNWMSEIADINRKKAKTHGYRLVVRESTTLGKNGLVRSEWIDCQVNNMTEDECRALHERMNNNWEKEAMLVDYLNKKDVNHVLIMDGDAALVHPKDDTMRKMAEELDRTNKDILIADEDWSPTGKGLLNGGLVFAKNTNFTRTFFQEMLKAHVFGMDYHGDAPRCKNNEQLCLSAALTKYPGFKEKLLVVSGSRWNRHPCLWGTHCKNGKAQSVEIFDPSLQVVHFMGPKQMAHRTLHNLGLVK